MTAEHPTDDTWERLATGELDDAARREVMAHVVGCAQCARTWRVVKHVAREARAFDPGVPATAPDEGSGTHAAPFRRTRRALFVGGGVALAAAAALLLWMHSGSHRAQDDATGMRGGEAAAVQLGRAAANRLAWEPVAGAQRYRVEVFGLDGVLVWSADGVAGTSIAVEPPLPRGDYRWLVEAWSDGRRLGASRPGRFAVP